jgi:DNA-directed RNA polymerase specialized sigma24 family protein
MLVGNQKLDRIDANNDRPFDDLSPRARRMLELARLLPKPDQLLLELILRARLSRRDIARILEVDAGTVSRRYYRLSRRLSDPLVVALSEPNCALPPLERQVALDRHVVGMKIEDIARKHRLSVHEIRTILIVVRGWARGVQPASLLAAPTRADGRIALGLRTAALAR